VKASAEYKYEVKVADFGLSRIISEGRQYYKSNQANNPVKWSAPESLQYEKFSTASDVWSFGVVLYEFFSRGMLPYLYGKIRCGLFFKIYRNVERRYCRKSNIRISTPKPEECPNEIYAIMLQCWHVKPEERPSFNTIVTEIATLNPVGYSPEVQQQNKEETPLYTVSKIFISFSSIKIELTGTR
jgi:serine/threonine protein kinase